MQSRQIDKHRGRRVNDRMDILSGLEGHPVQRAFIGS